MPFLTLKEACMSFTGPPQWWKLLARSFLALKMPCCGFITPPQWCKLLFGSFLTLKVGWTSFAALPSTFSLPPKLAYTSFAGPPQRWKMVSMSFLTHKLTSKSFTRPSQWWTLLFLTHKHACMSFTGPPDLRKIFSIPFLASQGLHSCENCFLGLSLHWKSCATASQNLHTLKLRVEKISFYAIPSTYSGKHEVNRASIVVKTPF